MYERISKEQLAQFGFDAHKFKTVSRGKEYQGPCPQCGGRDRLIVSNGMYWCRQCNWSGSLVKLLKEPPSAEELARANERYERQRAQEQKQADKERSQKLRDLNKSRVWEIFHSNLLEKPDILQLLEKDGITKIGVERFRLGYIPEFHYWTDSEPFTSPAIAFPIFWNKQCFNIRVRILAEMEGDRYRPYLVGMGASFYLADFPNEDWVVLVEGEKKAIVLWLNGIPAVGIQGAWTFKDKWIPFFKERWKHIYLALDPDMRNHMSEKRLKESLNAHVIHLDDKPDDMFVNGSMTSLKLVEILTKSLYE